MIVSAQPQKVLPLNVYPQMIDLFCLRLVLMTDRSGVTFHFAVENSLV